MLSGLGMAQDLVPGLGRKTYPGCRGLGCDYLPKFPGRVPESAKSDPNADKGGGGQKIKKFCGHHYKKI